MVAFSKDLPETLQPYAALGLDIGWSAGDKDVSTDCPWCGREGRFNIRVKDGLWRCPACEEGNESGGGNATVFVNLLWSKSYDATTLSDWSPFAEERGYLDANSLSHWQLAKSILTNQWLLPGYSGGGKLSTVYQYSRLNNRMAWIPTPTLHHHLFGVALYERSKPNLYLCEGIWDAIALWETLRACKLNDQDKLVPTGNPEMSLLAQANVLAIPSNLTFKDSWLPLFAGKDVKLMAQNDHPKKHPKTGSMMPPASYTGMERLARTLQVSKEPVNSIELLHWGAEGYNKELKSGYDLRDALCLEAQ